MLSEFSERVVERLSRAGVALPSPELMTLHGRYIELLRKWNRTINLTSLTLDPLSDEAIDRLLVEPIAASARVGMGTDADRSNRSAVKIIDIGTGGGSPAIPFWVQVPGSDLTMVESRSRKCAFLNEAARQIRPGSGRAFASRFENLLAEHPGLAQSADIVTVRAVRLDEPTRTLIGNLLADGGRVFHFGAELEIVECSTWNGC